MPKRSSRSTNGRHAATAQQSRPNILEAALALRSRGFSVVPCQGKKPIAKGWDKKRLTEERLRRDLDGTNLNIALALNQSELIDVECDSPEAEANLQLLFGRKIPPTPTWKSTPHCAQLTAHFSC